MGMLNKHMPEQTSANDSPPSGVIPPTVSPLADATKVKISVEQSGTMNDLEPEDKRDNVSTPLPRLAYTMEETAKILGVSYISIHRLLKRGLLRSSSALRHKVIPFTEIERFLKNTTK